MSSQPIDNDADIDLFGMNRSELLEVALKLRKAIRKHRDSTGHDLCWYHPELWLLLPERTLPTPGVPEWGEFISNCACYRKSLDTIPPS